MFDLIVKNATLGDGRSGVDIACEGGRIAAIEAGITAEAKEVVDAQGYIVSPPFVDPHFHMDATLSLYHHAALRRVKRVVLASSNWLHGDKRFTRDRLTSETPPGPVNAYGMSKLFCERTGAYFAKHYDLSVICMRIGWTQWTHNNRPGPHMAMGRWGQEMWLSDRDFLGGMIAAISAQDVDFAVLNLMSDNPGMRWDIEETKRLIGYAPQDGSAATVGPSIIIESALRRFFTRIVPRAYERLFSNW